MRTAMIEKGFGTRLAGFLLVGLAIVLGNVSVNASTIEGIVKDPNGRAISGADIRIEGRSQNSSKVVKSDAKGHYVYGDATAGVTYRVTLLVSGAAKASINNVQAKSEPTQLNFDLKAGNASQVSGPPAKKGKHMVWMPAQTGTNIGGRWVEVDEGSAPNGNERIQRVGGAALNRVQSNSGTSRHGN
jgi:hypothetical protein